MKSRKCSLVQFCVASLVILNWQYTGASKTRIIATKYGKVQGQKQNLGVLLGQVNVFKGIPYASPPTEDGRFTPTNTPSPWEGVLDASIQPPVCPQIFPALAKAENRMPKARVTLIRNIMKALSNQSEDCLTLNVYSPAISTSSVDSYPVMVYIHGESFSWGAGSLYDGSFLSAYGRVVIVTVNFRLGPLGYLNTYGGGGGVVGNFALLDQIAALNWIAENIAQFSGDSRRVTLFGRDSGAACISYLARSPIVPAGLFHRAILLSGGSICPWAKVQSPLSITLRLASHLKCPLPADPGATSPSTVECLRKAPLISLMNAARDITPPAFFPVWGPSEDGVAVAREKRASFRGHRTIDWIIGFTPYESAIWMGQAMLADGISDNNFYEKVIRTWIRNTRKTHHREVMAAILQEYTDWTVTELNPYKKRNLLLSLLTDAGFTAPLYKEADILTDSGNVFIFTCELLRKEDNTTIQYPGWELSLVWGVGLSDLGSRTETVLPPIPAAEFAQVSEDLITLLTNFAKSGDPNLPRESPSPGFAAIAWPPYRKHSKKYLKIGVPPSVGENYRTHQLALWNWLIPELEAAGDSSYHDNNSWEFSSDKSLFYGEVRPPDPWDFMPHPPSTTSYQDDISAAPAAQETTLGYESLQITTTLALAPTNAENSKSPEKHEYMRYSTALLVTGGLGISLLMLNVFVFILLFWRRSGINEQQKISKAQKLSSTYKVPRSNSLASMSVDVDDDICNTLPGTYGIQPDCIRSSCDNISVTQKPLENVCCNRATITTIQNQEAHSAANGSSEKKESIPNVIPSTQSYKRETSFTLSPALLNNFQMGSHHVECDEEYRSKVQGYFYSLKRRPLTQSACAKRTNDLLTTNPDSSIDGQTIAACTTGQQEQCPMNTSTLDRPAGQSPCGILCNQRAPNGWDLYRPQCTETLPQAPPPPRISTLRKDKKVTIIEEAVHRL